MKRFLSFFLIALLVLSLCSCTDSKGPENEQKTESMSTENGVPEKNGVQGIELPDLPVSSGSGSSSSDSDSSVSSDPDSSVSSDGNVSSASPSQGSDSEQSEPGSEGNNGNSSSSSSSQGIELPEFEF